MEGAARAGGDRYLAGRMELAPEALPAGCALPRAASRAPDRSNSPPLERLGELHLRATSREAAARESAPPLLPADRRRVGQSRGDPRGQLRRGDPEPRGRPALSTAADDGAAEAQLGVALPGRHGYPGGVEVDDSFFGLSTRGENYRRLRSAPPARALALAVASRARRSGRSARVCGSVWPGWIPALRAGRVAATTARGVAVALEDATASPASSGSLRTARRAKERHDDAGDARGGGHGSPGGSKDRCEGAAAGRQRRESAAVSESISARRGILDSLSRESRDPAPTRTLGAAPPPIQVRRPPSIAARPPRTAHAIRRREKEGRAFDLRPRARDAPKLPHELRRATAATRDPRRRAETRSRGAFPRRRALP